MTTGALLQADWPAPPRVHAFTTLRHGAGTSLPPFDHFNMGNKYAVGGDHPETVERNRLELAEDFGLPSPPHWLRQVHGTGVLRFDQAAGSSFGFGGQRESQGQGTPPRSSPSLREREEAKARAEAKAVAKTEIKAEAKAGAEAAAGAAAAAAKSDAKAEPEPEADAAVTSTPGTVLAILSADCLPVLLAARDGTEVGAAHAGWRGLADGVIEATVLAMRTPASALVAWLGPAAGPQAYEVGQEVFDAFVLPDPDAAIAFSSTRPGHWRVDLYALARLRLRAAGVGVGRIHGGGLCTISDPQRFYSHRRDACTGRLATLVWIDR